MIGTYYYRYGDTIIIIVVCICPVCCTRYTAHTRITRDGAAQMEESVPHGECSSWAFPRQRAATRGTVFPSQREKPAEAVPSAHHSRLLTSVLGPKTFLVPRP